MSFSCLSRGAGRARPAFGGLTGGVVATLIALMPVTAMGGGGGGRICIRAWKEAPYRSLGYDHIVAVHNGCERARRCTVTSDVSPASYTVTVEHNRTVRVLTFRGAPRRQFAARVRCRAAE